MRIIVNDEAKKRIRETAKYIHKKFGKKARLDFRDCRREPEKQAEQVKNR